MSDNCYSGISTPDKILEICNGEYTSDVCIIHPQAIPYLDLPANSSLNTIVNTFILALMRKDEQIAELEALINP